MMNLGLVRYGLLTGICLWLRVIPGIAARAVIPAIAGVAYLGIPDIQEFQGIQGIRASPAIVVIQVYQDIRVIPAYLVTLGIQVYRGLVDLMHRLPVIQDIAAYQGILVIQA